MCVHGFSMEVWPGFQTSILPYVGGMYLQLELVHKLLSTKTCLDVLNFAQRARGSATDVARKELVGQIVLTRFVNIAQSVV